MPKIAVSRHGRIFRPGGGLPDVPSTGVVVTELEKTLILDKFAAGGYSFSIIDVTNVTPIPNSNEPMTAAQVSQAITDALGSVGMIARAQNRTGVATAATVSPAPAAAILGCVMAVPPSKRAVHIQTSVVWSIQVAGAGRLNVVTYELTGGTPVLLNSAYRVTAAATPAAGNFGGPQQDEFPIGPSDNWRVYGLYCQVNRDAGSALAASVFNFNSTVAQSSIKAVAL